MSKLYFRFGVTGSSKTAIALMTKFNYEEKGSKVFLGKPSIDTRDGQNIIKSRIGLQANCCPIDPNIDITIYFNSDEYDCVIIDECQFLSVDQIEQLKDTSLKIPVFCFGLKTDFMSHLFPASKRLLEIADSISEVKSICYCGKKAIINARYENDKIIYNGDIIDLGGNEKYIGMCYDCWKHSRLLIFS